MPRILVDISSHGFGHLGQTAPVLNALAATLPDLDLTVRTGLPERRLALRIETAFTYRGGATDFGYAMHNAIDLDLGETAARYREFHRDWPARVAREAEWLAAERFDAVISNVSYLALAGAARVGIPGIAACSLNWADMFADSFGTEAWAPPIRQQMLAAYRSARTFLRFTPGMPMRSLANVTAVGPVCRLRASARPELAARLGIDADRTWLLVAMGGMDFPIDLRCWPRLDGVHFLVPAALAAERDDVTVFELPDTDFTQLVASVDAVLTKPGYGTFVEAWAEQAPLTDWLHRHARAWRIDRDQLVAGDLAPALAALAGQPVPPRPAPTGIDEAVAAIRAIIAA
jgi:hypothetical protein